MDNISIKNLSFTYSGRSEPTINQVNLTIQPATITVVVGASGSGKSTLCYTLNGAIPHLIPGQLTGEITVFGLNTVTHSVYDLAQQVGLVFQDPETMFANLVVSDEIAFGPANLGWPKADILARVQEVIAYVGLQGLEEQYVWNLSGGQVQRLALASVLAMKPKVIILDEPTSNLDPDARQTVYLLIQRLKSEGSAVVIVTKELDELLPATDQLVVVDQGQIVFSGPPRPVLDQFGPQMRQLGIWLPEMVELGLDLREKIGRPDLSLPFTVDEAAHILQDYDIRSEPTVDGFFNPLQLQNALTVISAQHVTYSYPGATQAAVNGVSFEFQQGEMVAILGRNGAGKSTLAKLMMGLIKPTSGELTIVDMNVGQTPPQVLANEIAFVFQNPEHQFVTDTVYDELAYSLIANRVPEAEIERRVNATLRLMDLEDVRHDHPFGLSAGKKRRLGVATMLIGQPRILVVDEPTYGQDRRMTDSLMQIMLRLQQAGTTVVMITHDMRLVESYIPRSLVMVNGELLFDGATSELFQQQDILQRASLRVTALYELAGQLRSQGQVLPDKLTHLSQLVSLFSGSNRTHKVTLGRNIEE